MKIFTGVEEMLETYTEIQELILFIVFHEGGRQLTYAVQSPSLNATHIHLSDETRTRTAENDATASMWV